MIQNLKINPLNTSFVIWLNRITKNNYIWPRNIWFFATTSYSSHYKLLSSSQWMFKNMQNYDNIDVKNFGFLATFIILVQAMTWVFLMQ